MDRVLVPAYFRFVTRDVCVTSETRRRLNIDILKRKARGDIFSRSRSLDGYRESLEFTITRFPNRTSAAAIERTITDVEEDSGTWHSTR